MAKILRSQPNVGDIVVRIAESDDEFIQGDSYEVINVDADGDAEVIDRYGGVTSILDYELKRFTMLEEDDEDPGYLDVYLRTPIDSVGTGVAEVVVDARSLALLEKLQKQHERAKARNKIREKIKVLEEELKKI